MNFEKFLEKTVKSETTKMSYIQALKKLNIFLQSNQFIHGGAYLNEVKSILIQELDWKYDVENKKIYDYREKLLEKNTFLKSLESVEILSVENLENLKKLTAIDGNYVLRAVSKADGNGAISASIGKLIEWKKSEELKKLQLEFWDELRKIYLDHNILKQDATGIDIKFGKEYHLYIVHLNNKNLLTIKLYIPENKELFKKFEEQKENIEKEIGSELEWLLKETKATTISKNLDFNIEKREQWEELLNSLSNEITKFINIFGKYEKKLEDINLNNNLEEKMEYQRIVYGAPGTGKSYMLKEESENNFKNIDIEKDVIDSDENLDERQYWLVGAFWGSENKLDEFVKNGYWQNGYEDKFINKVKQIKVGDYIGIKSLNRHKNETIVKALGIVIRNYNDGNKIDVKWLITEEISYPNRRYNTTVHQITGERTDMFYPLIELEKSSGKVFKTLKETINVIERVTFYDGYTYGQFVGTYKPVPSEDNSENIIYKYIPGPVMTTLVKALKNPQHKFLLIIEEINRAKADRVFGNIFQLLDRDDDGKSEYPIAISLEIEKYLKEEFEDESQYQEYFGKGLLLPKNLYIWATMNNADQGVYPLDTAFKRRWNFEYIGLDDNAEKFGKKENEYLVDLEFNINEKNIKEVPKYVSWNNFRENLNTFLLENGINEDRLIAPFFIKPSQFIKDKGKFKNSFWINESSYLNKLLMYVFDDILKHKVSVRKKLFAEDILSFSHLIKKYKVGECIFNEYFLNKLFIQEWK
ncbi:DUF4268 domain-containing protein [Cetobacterium sp.]|uniref:DUF4268 domain-containing protein n=1 Tax=Cetobacterium sp. TaxID=2071632 RepID=UPI002FC924F6